MPIQGESVIKSIDDFRAVFDPDTAALCARLPPSQRNIVEMNMNRIDGIIAKYFEEKTRIDTGSNRLWTEDSRYEARTQSARTTSIAAFEFEKYASAPLWKRIRDVEEAAARALSSANSSEDRLLNYMRALEIRDGLRELLRRTGRPGQTLNHVDDQALLQRLENAAMNGDDEEFLDAVLGAQRGFELLDGEATTRIQAARMRRLTSNADPLREEVKHYENAVATVRAILQPLLPEESAPVAGR